MRRKKTITEYCNHHHKKQWANPKQYELLRGKGPLHFNLRYSQIYLMAVDIASLGEISAIDITPDEKPNKLKVRTGEALSFPNQIPKTDTFMTNR